LEPSHSAGLLTHQIWLSGSLAGGAVVSECDGQPLRQSIACGRMLIFTKPEKFSGPNLAG
jgi:hypothetical protein